MTDAAILAEIAAAAEDDPGPALVFADLLQQRGDPRGELIAIQYELESADGARTAELRRRETALFESHSDAFAGELRAHHTLVSVRWARGFIVGARVSEGGQGILGRPLAALLGAPYVRDTLVELRLGPAASRHDSESIELLVRDLVGSWPRALRRLHLNVVDLDERSCTVVTDVAALTDLDGSDYRLDELAIGGRGHKLERWHSTPRLARLVMRGAFDAVDLQRLAPWPALVELEVWASSPDRIPAVITPAAFPALRTLAIVGFPHQAVAMLRGAPILDQLETLSLRGGTLGDADVAWLAALPSTIRTLDVRGNGIGPIALRELESARAATVLGGPQRRAPKHEAGAGRLEPLTSRDQVEAAKLRFRTALDESRGDVARAAVEILELVGSGAFERLRYARAMIGDPSELARVVRRAEAELWPAHATGGFAKLAAELGDRYVRTDGLAAESWFWQAVRHARWTGDAVTERAVLERVKALARRRGSR